MPKSPNFFFPDVNVWLAITYDRHVHHPAAGAWYNPLGPDCRLYFCRQTQLGLLRLLSTEAVMGRDRVLGQREAWQLYDGWREDRRLDFLEEPPGVETELRALTQDWLPSPKVWMDAFLAAFAMVAGLTLVTFDQALGGRTHAVLILET